MTNEETKALCLALMKADTEAELINLFKDANFWEDQSLWRYYGDNENNYGTIVSPQLEMERAFFR